MACYSSPDLTWPLAASSLLSLFPPPASRKEASYIRFPHSGSRPCTRQVFCVNRFLSTYQVFFPLTRSPTWLTVLFLMHVKPTTQYPSWLIYSLSLSLSKHFKRKDITWDQISGSCALLKGNVYGSL